MFEAIRQHTKWVMGLLFLLIIPSFVLVGIDRNYFSGGSPVVAHVDGKDITQEEWDAAHRNESDRIRAENPGVDGKLLDAPRARYSTLERLVRDRVLQAAAQNLHLSVSDARLAQELQSIPQIAALKRPDGSLDAQAYRALVGSQGLTPEGFEAQMRHDLAVNQVLGGVLSTGFAAPADAKLAMDALLQRREIQVAQFKAADFVAKVVPTEAQLQEFYQKNPALFQQQEQATVEYVLLDLEAVKDGLKLSEDDLRTYYKENLSRLAGQEERRASHILIAAAKEAPAVEREAAKTKAQELLEQLRKAPGQFAEMAKRESKDPGSAPMGGDLGFFARGAMVKPFEDAAYALKKGEISEVVESDFGYHIIVLTDIKTPRQPSFDELRPKLEAELKQQQAQRQFAEVAETFANMVYEQAEGLQPVADKLKLKIRTADKVTRQPGLGASGVLANSRFLEALFQPESLQSKRNTEAIEVGASQMAAGRVVAYQPAALIAFDQAQDKLRSLYVKQQAAQLAQAEGEAKLAAWKAAPASAVGLSPASFVSREQAGQWPAMVLKAALQAPIDALPSWVGVGLGDDGYAVIKLIRVESRPVQTSELAKVEQQQYQQAWTGTEALAYYEWLKQRFKVQMKVERPKSEN